MFSYLLSGLAPPDMHQPNFFVKTCIYSFAPTTSIVLEIECSSTTYSHILGVTKTKTLENQDLRPGLRFRSAKTKTIEGFSSKTL